VIQDNLNEKNLEKIPAKVSSVSNLLRVLLVEDDDELRELLTWALQKEGYDVTECTDGMIWLDHLSGDPFYGEANDFHLIISNILMPCITRIEILEGLHTLENFPPMILIPAFGDEETHVQAHRLGTAAIFDKPFDIEDLVAKVREILQPSLTSSK
jgi:DNA-binding response OmpR family regulator